MLSGTVLKQSRTYLKSRVGHGLSVEGRKSQASFFTMEGYLITAFLHKNSSQILKRLKKSIKKENINVILLTGGTGLTGRDSTPEAVKKILDKEIPGFGEIFRYVSFKKIGTSSLQSRAIAGLANGKFIFAIPGSTGACKDAWNEILKHQLDSRTKPCNLVELIPRIFEKKKPINSGKKFF